MVQIFSADTQGVGQGCDMIRSYLEKKGIRGKVNARMVLVAEEAMMDLIQHREEGSQLTVSLKCFMEAVTSRRWHFYPAEKMNRGYR